MEAESQNKVKQGLDDAACGLDAVGTRSPSPELNMRLYLPFPQKCSIYPLSVPEVPDTRKRHRHTKPVGCGDYFRVTDRSPRLNDRGCPGLGNGLKPVGEREISIGGGDRALQWKNGLHRTKSGGVDPAHLSRSDPH